MKKILSSSKRPIWIGKTVTKELATKKEFDQNVMICSALKEAGIYEVFTYDPNSLTITYDFIEGTENQDITTYQNALNLVNSYNKKVQIKVPRVDELQKSITGFQWEDWMYDLVGRDFTWMTHQDINKVNIIKQPDGKYSVIDWEFCSLGPRYYDLGSWCQNQVQAKIKNPKPDIKKILESIVPSNARSLVYPFTLIDAMYRLSYKQMIAKQRKVYNIWMLEKLIDYLRSELKV